MTGRTAGGENRKVILRCKIEKLYTYLCIFQLQGMRDMLKVSYPFEVTQLSTRNYTENTQYMLT